jgi:hypothetical protein
VQIGGLSRSAIEGVIARDPDANHDPHESRELALQSASRNPGNEYGTQELRKDFQSAIRNPIFAIALHPLRLCGSIPD